MLRLATLSLFVHALASKTMHSKGRKRTGAIGKIGLSLILCLGGILLGIFVVYSLATPCEIYCSTSGPSSVPTITVSSAACSFSNQSNTEITSCYFGFDNPSPHNVLVTDLNLTRTGNVNFVEAVRPNCILPSSGVGNFSFAFQTPESVNLTSGTVLNYEANFDDGQSILGVVPIT